MTLHHRVMSTIAARALWSPGDRVAVAVSGGLDSICLLDVLALTARHHGARLSVVTVDHGTRDGSAADATFVVREAARRRLPCAVARVELGPGASEAACRDARYAAFARLGVDHVALAHHRADQAETALLGLMRGGGTRALGAMTWRRGSHVRPLLDVGRDAILGWAAARGLAWREDPSNASPAFLRNRVRHELLPLIEALRPGAGAAIARGAGHAAEDDAFLQALAAAAPWDGAGWPTPWIATGPAPIVRRALRSGCPSASSAHLDAVVACARRGSGEVDLGGGHRVVVGADRVVPIGVAGR